jgi:glycosyltransferase involved in cell wall biosynthesis
MYQGQRIAVVVPAFNEADKIERAIHSVPGFVDDVFVINDGSADGTGALASRCRRAGLSVVHHAHNLGVGAAIATGYRRALATGAEVAVVMAGDCQMDPADLPALLDAIVTGADYAKGNRFSGRGFMRAMPPGRIFGNVILSWLTRVASGLGHVFDSQCGYTAANRKALAAILAGPVFARYGYPNDLLIRLARDGLSVRDVAVRPIYGPGWRSGLRPWRVAVPIARLLVRGMAARLGRRTATESRQPALTP